MDPTRNRILKVCITAKIPDNVYGGGTVSSVQLSLNILIDKLSKFQSRKLYNMRTEILKLLKLTVEEQTATINMNYTIL